MRGSQIAPLFVGLGLALATAPLTADCVVTQRSNNDPSVNAIKLIPVNIPANLSDPFQRAYGHWNSTSCNIGLDSFPQFKTNTGERVLTIEFHTGFNPVDDRRCGEFQGLRVDLYEKAKDGTTTRFCTRADVFEDTVTHELGHALGLQHPTSGSCDKFAMQHAKWTPSGYINRTLQSDECMKARETHWTPSEQEAESGGMEDPCAEGSDDSGACTPIVIDYGDDGFLLTGIEDPVAFDVDGDGLVEILSWTARKHLDFFLCFDRNENGLIDDGSELFGNATPLVSGTKAAHGFQALFEIDADGGNRNGFVDVWDPAFKSLCGWQDFNHNGRSEPFEIQSLQALGITAIAVEYRVSLQEDEHGNRLRFLSSAYIQEPTGELRRVDIVDVFFLVGRHGAHR